MVSLQDFVSQSLCDILDGVRAAQGTPIGKGVAPAPFQPGGVDGPALGGYITATMQLSQFVDFDIAVTASEGTKTAGGVGVLVGIFTLGSSGQSKADTSTVSRLKFRVPIAL